MAYNSQTIKMILRISAELPTIRSRCSHRVLFSSFAYAGKLSMLGENKRALPAFAGKAFSLVGVM